MLSLTIPSLQAPKVKPSQGFTLIEVLVTLVITAIALFGIVELQNRSQVASLEATQRAYAEVIANNMSEHINANPGMGDDCTFASSTAGWGTTANTYTCSANPFAQYSIRQWHSLLVGANEKIGTTQIGTVKDGQGCIQYTAPNTAAGTLGKYTVSVAWRGFQKSASGGPVGSCGHGDYGNSGLHRLVYSDIYLSKPTVACSQQPPTATLPVVVITQSWVNQPSRVINSDQVLVVTGAGNYNGSLAVRSGGHVVVSGSVGIFGSVNINSGGHYWRTSTTGFTGSLAMNGTEHIEPEGCDWFPLSACGVNVNSCENGGTISGHDNRNSDTCFKESVNWTKHPHMNGRTLTILGDVTIGDCGGGFRGGGGTIRTTGYTTATCSLPSSVTIERCAQ